MDCLFDVLPTVLFAVARDIANHARLAVGEAVELAVLGWLDCEMLVMGSSDLRFERVVHVG